MAMVGPVPAINPPYAYASGYRGEEGERERQIMHYTSSHNILLVGDGDFSFSLCLARAFGSAFNIVATSLDSYDELMKKYSQARSNVDKLNSLGAQVIHGVDATKMRHHTDLEERKFDRIIFNFPHAGFYGKEDNCLLIEMHRSVVQGFFRNASGMLRPDGEIHVNHKTTAPFCLWGIYELAIQNSLCLIACVEFKKGDYPGYNHKRGSGPRSDEPFPLNKSSTYKFIFPATADRYLRISNSNDIAHRQPLQVLDIPVSFLPRETGQFQPEILILFYRLIEIPINELTSSQLVELLKVRDKLESFAPLVFSSEQRVMLNVYLKELKANFDDIRYHQGKISHAQSTIENVSATISKIKDHIEVFKTLQSDLAAVCIEEDELRKQLEAIQQERMNLESNLLNTFQATKRLMASIADDPTFLATAHQDIT